MKVDLPEPIAAMARANGTLKPPTLATGVVRRAFGAEVLHDQLEGPWRGFGALSRPRLRGLQQLGLTALGRRAEGRWIHPMTEADIDPEVARLVEGCAARHAHGATVTIDMVRLAKDGQGVVASSEFAWARKDDPRLFLMFNGWGRTNHVAAIAGAYAHHGLEAKLGRPLPEADFGALADEIGADMVLADG